MTRLLIVDDEYHLIESMLSSIPWESAGVEEVVGAYSALEALELLEERDFDIVITDVKMPEMDGLELTAIIKKRWRYIKCILLSGYVEFELVKTGMRNEASDYLLKPVRDEVLLTRSGSWRLFSSRRRNRSGHIWNPRRSSTKVSRFCVLSCSAIWCPAANGRSGSWRSAWSSTTSAYATATASHCC
ncbi:response regulator [Paenibacillus sp. D2_2]|uniref:response regulator n=1 Tax=Paenibacillus sp. D2_2 TaxID=3073092 RepID=UPI002815082C|nr:response regulator [Paenibacillus sp. D2_2]WMT43024.1 response regulator [Paenibacillus sp. D2_2]